MSNSIDKNLGKENNSMLSFHWTAIFSDGKIIRQFEENRKENLFKEIKDRFNDLVFFNLTNNKGKYFSVNLIQGILGFNDLVLPYRNSKEIKKNIRLIFFRRHQVTMGDNGKEQNHTITYHLGFQHNDEKGNNKQIILQIDEEGNFIIE